MTPASDSLRRADIPFGDKDFDSIAHIAKSSFGLHLEVSKKALIQSRLTRRLIALGLSDFASYCDLLRSQNAQETDVFISALTTNVTHFYREPHHFEHFETTVLPELVARARAGARVRLWSAGCSTGQEAYSLAGSVAHVCANAAALDLRILATDIDAQVLATAQLATYRADECRFPSDAWKARVFADPPGGAERWTIRGDVRDLVTFRRLNLMQPWPMSGRFDVIMCRNVAIYFDKPTQSRLWGRFVDQMTDGGTLYIGHSERVQGPAEENLKNVAITTYCKKPAW